ncbi:MAG: phenylalanine--tRNA ligase subunit beta [Methanosarcinales archaeon]|nr:phenylalanine--tRNA ligase subunit beta [Methanosarcinales archaeon]
MPVVRLYYQDLEEMVGAPRETIMNRLPMIGADIGKRAEEDHVDVEFFPDRPDLYSSEGVARAMQGFLEVETGLVEYEVHPGKVALDVDLSVKDVRPIIGCAVVRGLEFTDPAIESLMDLQEDLHWGLGRNRKKVAIGVHDISRVEPPFRYLGENPEREFVPLGYEESMSMREMLKRHPKGMDYGHILDGFDRYPLIVDAKNRVLSFPPIINGQLTSVTETTRDLFIDVTGTDPVVHRALNIVVCALAERGGRIESVLVRDQASAFSSPDLKPSRWTVDHEEANRLIGTQMSQEEAVGCLRRMRFGAQKKGPEIEVLVPAYRADIMHSWDIFEDLAKGFGYENIPAHLPGTNTIARAHPLEERKAEVREVMAGLGYLETMPFTLTSEKVNFRNMGRHEGGHTRVRHPISELHTMIRTSIMPSLLEIFSFNQHHPLPQRIFAVGDVVIEGRTRTSLAAASIHSAAGFAEIRSVVDAVLRDLGLDLQIVPSDNGAFIPGRGADLVAEQEANLESGRAGGAGRSGGRRLGCFGEVHPQTIVGFGLEQPVVALELLIDA